MAAAAWWGVAGYDLGPVAFWGQVENSILAFTLVSAPLCVMVGALDWSLLWGRAGRYVPGPAIGSTAPLWRVWLAVTAWLLAGWTAGTLLGVATFDGVIVGRPNLPVVLVAASVVPAFSGLGLLAGRMLPRLAGPLLAGVGTYFAMGLLMYGGSRLRVLAPMADTVPPLGGAFSVPFSLSQVGLLGSLGVGSSFLLIALESGIHRLWTAATAGVAAGLAALLLSIPAVVEVGFERACSGGDPQVCGPEALGPVFDSIGAVAAAFAQLTGVEVTGVELDAGAGGPEFDQASGTLRLNVGHSDPMLAAARTLVGPGAAVACNSGAASEVVAEGLVFLSGSPDSAISALGKQVGRAMSAASPWLADNLDRLRDCEVALAELPGVG